MSAERQALAERWLPWADLVSGLLVGAFVVLRPLVSADPIGPAHNLALAALPLFACLLTVVPRVGLGQDLPMPSARIGAPLAVLLGLALLSPMVAASPYPAAIAAGIWWGHFGLFLFTLAWAGPGLRRALTAALAANAVLIVAYAWDQHLYLFGETRRMVTESPGSVHFLARAQMYEFMTRLWTNEPYGPFVTSNALAAFLTLVAPLLTWLGWQLWHARHPKLGLIWIAIAITAVGALVLTRSKGGAGGFVVTLGALAAWERRAWLLARPRALVAAAAIALLLGGWATLGGAFDPLGLRNPYSSMGVRLGYWNGALRLLAERPLAGIGLDNFADAYTRVKPETGSEVQKVHNDFLQVATELGIPGGVAFLAFWLGVLWPGARKAAAPATGPPEAAGPTSRIGAMVGVLGALIVAHTQVGTAPWPGVEDLYGEIGWVTAAVWLGLYSLAWKAQTLETAASVHPCLFAGIAGVLAHMTLDMDFTVHNLAPALLLAAALLSSPLPPARLDDRSRRLLLLGGLGMTFAVVAGWILISQRLLPSERLRDEARYGVDGGMPTAIERTALLAQAVELNPWDPAAWQAYGNDRHGACLQAGAPPTEDSRFGRLPSCEAAAEMALRAAPESAALAAALTRVRLDHLRSAKEPERAALLKRTVAAAQLAVDLYPTNALYHWLLMESLDRRGDRPAAQSAARRALELSRRQPLGRLKLTPEQERTLTTRLRE